MGCLSHPNAIIYSIVILFSLATFGMCIAALSLENWVQFSLPTGSGASSSGDWSKISMGLFRTRTTPTNLARAGSPNLSGSLIFSTDDLLSYYSSLFSSAGCGGLSSKFDDLDAGNKICASLVCLGLAFAFASFVVMYLGVSRKSGFQKPHLWSAVLYFLSAGPLVGAAVIYHQRVDALGDMQCKNYKASWTSDYDTGYILLCFAVAQCAVCAVALCFKQSSERDDYKAAFSQNDEKISPIV
jgi:hypothetical protein